MTHGAIMYCLATCFWVSLRTLSPQGLSIAPDILRFFSLFQAVYLLTSGWIEPLLVGGHAPFSPAVVEESCEDAPAETEVLIVTL